MNGYKQKIVAVLRPKEARKGVCFEIKISQERHATFATSDKKFVCHWFASESGYYSNASLLAFV